MKVIANIEKHLRDAIGFDVQSVGNGIFAAAVQARMRHYRTGDQEQYYSVLIERQGERQALIEEVVVAETWFFRDWNPFFFLGRWAANTWLPAHPEATLRVLSAPCSTGEEPFSIVMALLDAGLPPNRFIVEAVDISQQALARARKGVYSQNSFRGGRLEFRDKYFEKAGAGWRLKSLVKDQVKFEHANLVDPCFRAGDAGLDIVFCRNLLIYLAPEVQTELIGRLRSLLSPDGLFFVGHAEAFIASQCNLEPVQAMTFAFRKRTTAPRRSVFTADAPVAKARRHFPPPIVLPAVAPKPAHRPQAVDARQKPLPSPVQPPSPAAALNEIQRLADHGDYDAAKQSCESSLHTHGPSPGLFCLLGLIHEASGKAGQAREFYRKALYLEPGHVESLAHLALLERAAGNRAAASRLENRMRAAEAPHHPNSDLRISHS